MTNPIDAAGKFLAQTFQPLQQGVQDVVDDAVETATDIAETATDIGGDVLDAGGALLEAGQTFVGEVAQSVQQAGPLNVAVDVARHNASVVSEIIAQAAQVPLGQQTRDEFLHWLIGPDGPSFADATRQIPGLQDAMGNFMDTAMANPMIAGAIGRAFGFEYYAPGDFYTTNENSIQSNFGFHEVYDLAGDALGMDLTEQVVEFEYNGVEYKLEVWQGSYGFGGAFGGEIGLYTRGTGERGPFGDFLEGLDGGYYSAAAGNDQIRMTQQIYNVETGEVYFTNPGAGAADGDHYWNLAIRTDPGVNHEDIGQRGVLELGDPGLAQAMYNAMIAEGMDAQLDGSTITYDWP